MDKFFCFDGHCFNTFATMDEAKQDAQKALDYFSEDAGEGWDELVEQVCYGQITGGVVETERMPRREDDYGLDYGIDTVVNYGLRDAA